MKLVALSLALAVSACSFVTTSAPRPAPEPPACSESYGAPLLDVFGAFIGAPMLGLVTWALVHDERRETRDAMIGATIGASMLAFTISSVVGFVRVSRCKDAQSAYRGALMHAPPPVYAPPVYAPPPIAEPPAGTERGLCRTDGTCDAGLVCASNRCVVLPAP